MLSNRSLLANHSTYFSVQYFHFFGHPLADGVPRPGIRSESQFRPMQDSLNHCAKLGIEPASWRCRDATNPVVSQWEFLFPLFNGVFGTIEHFDEVPSVFYD